jgi:hypothetical protein
MAASFKNKISAAVGTSAVPVLTAASGSTAIGMSVANVLDEQINVDVTLTSGGVTGHLVKGAPVPKGGALVVIGGDQKVVLQAGDIISVKSDKAASADVILSYLQA